MIVYFNDTLVDDNVASGKNSVSPDSAQEQYKILIEKREQRIKELNHHMMKLYLLILMMTHQFRDGKGE